MFQKLYENLLITNVWQQLVNKPINDATRVLSSVVRAESKKMEPYFPFFRETEILDLERRAENYVIHSVFREGETKVGKYEPTHMQLRENFGNALFAENGQDYPEAHPYKAFENITKWEEGKHIRLIDGDSLVELMIKHSVGLERIKEYIVYKIDEDYFADIS